MGGADEGTWGRSTLRSWAARLILGLLAVASVASLLPLIETNTWWVRFLDFPRLQLAFALIVLLTGFAALSSQVGKIGWIVCTLGALGLGYHMSKLYAFTSLSARAAVDLERCDPDSSLTLMIANVQMRNEEASEFLMLVAEVNPDLLLVMETDAWWDRHLVPLHESFPETAQFIPAESGAFGMHVMSKLPLISPEFLFLFDGYTPTARTGVELPGGEVVQVIGVHPHPPLAWSQPTTLRDGTLLASALMARSSPSDTILAGDFNAVPWEPVGRRAARIGGLLDPRIGRGLFPTFSAGSVLMSWPLDQILFQDSFGLLEFAVLPDIGSDHLPVVARLCHTPGNPLLKAAPDLHPDDLEEAETSIQAAQDMPPEDRP